MRKTVVMLASALALCAQGAWYWPFGTDEDSTNAPPRLHRLLEPANDYIELAQDASLNGDTDKALENYRLALEELDRVEAEHPDRAASAEFAPLRLRRAACTAAIDSIRFAQVNENVRPVSVTDTTELQKRWNKAHGVGGDEDEPPAESKVEKEGKKEPEKKKEPEEEKNAEPPEQAEEKKPEPVAEEKKPADAQERVPPPASADAQERVPPPAPADAQERVPPAEKPPAVLPKDWNGRIAQAMADLRAQDYAAADVLLESMLKERPKDLNALLLRAAAQAGTRSYYAAQRTLERAMRAHPRSYLPYYNLANLLAQQEGGDLEAAREYYELGRTVGGPVNKALEARLKGIAK